MFENTISFFLTIIIIILILIIIYQKVIYKKGIQSQIKQINQQLSEIQDTNSDQKVMVFTDHQCLMDLCREINQLLLDYQKLKVDYKREEISSKKMLSNISHDIKTPLTVICGYLEIMRLQDTNNEMIEKVEAKANEVMTLINEFFTLAKLEAGDAPIEMTKLNINEICKENILSFYDLLLQNDFNVELAIPDTPIDVLGDKKAIDRILSNLISNAIRYGNDGHYLKMAIHDDGNDVYIDIIDKGKGIEKEFAAHVFDRLFTMEDSRNREIQGNGLGLTIAKKLATQLGGDILLESQPNIKTVFTLKLKKITY